VKGGTGGLVPSSQRGERPTARGNTELSVRSDFFTTGFDELERRLGTTGALRGEAPVSEAPVSEALVSEALVS